MESQLVFPRLVAQTLGGRHLILPDLLDDDYGLVVLVFRRHAQPMVDSWLHPFSREPFVHPRLHRWEVPMLAGGWRMVSGYIDGGMRAGIPPARHDQVATFYGDAGRHRAALGIDDLDSAYPVLIDGTGRVLWKESGWASPRKLENLHRRLSEVLPVTVSAS